jgi:hypothetical protein
MSISGSSSAFNAYPKPRNKLKNDAFTLPAVTPSNNQGR